MDFPSENQNAETSPAAEPPAGPTVPAITRSWIINAMLWAIFGLGLLLQAFSAHLQVGNGGFLVSAGGNTSSEIHPSRIVSRERKLQTASALLVVVGAGALAYYHRRYLIESFRWPAKKARPSREDR